MTELLYLAFNRLEFTRKSYETMLANTDWNLIDRLVIYDDGSSDGTCEYLEGQILAHAPVTTFFYRTRNLGPVGIMGDYLRRTSELRAPSTEQTCPSQLGARGSEVFVKIDNDVMLPPGWLPECLEVMDSNPALDLLGIEAIAGLDILPAGHAPRGFRATDHIGGIGLMRHHAFRCCRPAPPQDLRYGFTEWQWRHIFVNKGWLDPALPVGLLNLTPIEPWRSLSAEYIKRGWQRDWPGYQDNDARRWEWWV